MEKLKVAVVGVGGHGRNRHLVPYLKVKNVEVVAVVDVKEEVAHKVGEEFGVRYYTDHLEMMDRETPDLVSVVTPTGLHYSVAKDILRKGAHVLVDKPVASSVEQVEDLERTSRETGRKVMVGYWSRFSPALSYASRLVREEVGEVYLITTYLVRRRGIPGIPTFLDKSSNGGRGALLDIGCYAIDNALSPLDFPSPLTVSGMIYTKFGNREEEVKLNWGSWDPRTFDLEDYAVGMVRFKDFMMSVEVGWAGNVSHQGEVGVVRILGERGGLEMRGDEAMNEVSFHGVLGGKVVDVRPQLKKVDLHQAIVEEFVSSVREGREPFPNLRQSLVLHSIIDGIYRSSQKGREVSLV